MLGRVRRRGYRLTSAWSLPADPVRCWAVLADPSMSWPAWWPGVTAEHVDASDGGRVGSRARLRFRSPLAYSLAVELTVTSLDPLRRVALDVGGDLEGRADVTIGGDGDGGTRVDVLWDVRTVLTWMNVAGPVLAPAFARAHAHVMAVGERGLSRHLTAGRSDAG